MNKFQRPTRLHLVKNAVANLNEVQPTNDEPGHDGFVDNSVRTGPVRVYFRNLADELIAHINNADVVVGCVAWLTHFGILSALANKRCAIAVQKEDFLRPDGSGNPNTWAARLRERYARIPGDLDKWEFDGTILPLVSYNNSDSIEAVRCVGNHNADKDPAFPRMHNKFMLFCKTQQNEYMDFEIVPYGVWTGSFNMTSNAENSLENAIYTEAPTVVQAYWREFGQVMALSEPLDWERPWCAPEWRIGS